MRIARAGADFLTRSFLLVITAATPAIAQQRRPALPEGRTLINLSLEALGEIEVTTVSKEPEEVRRTAAAISVITQEDIRRSGATSLPEVLRLAPGVDVARIDSTHWSVGVRGFGDQFSKSVLVLIDGRSVYTPLFAGVLWAVQDVPLDDIERVEVIRGPGGTIWGANAVNGVINIVTKPAADTRGILIAAGTGNVDQGVGGVRFGGNRGTDFTYRLYVKGVRRGPQSHSDGQEFDAWRMGQSGFRADWTGGRDRVTLQGDFYKGHIGQSIAIGAISPPSQDLRYEPLAVSGGNVLAQWQRRLESSSLQLHAYYDRTHLLGPQLGESRHTVDADFMQQFAETHRQSVTWGLGARLSPSNIIQTVPTLDVTPHHQTTRIYSAFLQDDVALVRDRLTGIVGVKFEHHDSTGLEVQPSARLLWTPTERDSFWMAATRAVRTPSLLERNLQLTGFLAAAPPIFVRIVGNEDFASERLMGYEGGYRAAIGSRLYVDVSIFRNHHDNLESFGALSIIAEATPAPAHTILEFPYANGVRGTSAGGELAPTWKPVRWWQLRGSYSYLRIDVENKPGNTDTGAVATYEGSSPRHQVSLASQLSFSRGWELDQTYRYASALPARQVAAFSTADVQLRWHPLATLQLAIAGQNLLAASHVEFAHDPGPAVSIKRSVSVTMTWKR